MNKEELKAIYEKTKGIMHITQHKRFWNYFNLLKEENSCLKNFLYTIRDMTQEVLIVKGDKPGTYRPIKNTRRHEVYETIVKIRHFLYGEFIFLDHEKAIQKKLIEYLGEGEKNENS